MAAPLACCRRSRKWVFWHSVNCPPLPNLPNLTLSMGAAPHKHWQQLNPSSAERGTTQHPSLACPEEKVGSWAVLHLTTDWQDTCRNLSSLLFFSMPELLLYLLVESLRENFKGKKAHTERSFPLIKGPWEQDKCYTK